MRKCDDDIMVKPLNYDNDGPRRLGLKDMKENERNSKTWIIPSEEELADMQESLAIAVYARRELERLSVI